MHQTIWLFAALLIACGNTTRTESAMGGSPVSGGAAGFGGEPETHSGGASGAAGTPSASSGMGGSMPEAGGLAGTAGAAVGAGGTTQGGAAGMAGAGGVTFVQCPPSIPAANCGDGWVICDEQPLAQIPRQSVIKGSGTALYWLSAKGKRYVFPNEQVFRSWYPVGADCPMIFQLSDADLFPIMIGGNVTIRPGTFLIKITTDPKVYAISCGGVLHWMSSESVMSQIYGPGWASYVEDVIDGFFVNYTVGTSVDTPSGYDPYAELAKAPTPEENLACAGLL